MIKVWGTAGKTLLLTLLIFPALSINGSWADEFKMKRLKMVERQIAGRGVSDKRVLEALREVQRHRYVLPDDVEYAYTDGPLPIGEGQTISQPYIVAYMTEALHLTGDEKVLEIGTGSGYQAAVLAKLCKEVYTVEIIESLQRRATALLEGMGYQNVFTRHTDGYFGWEEKAPFDAIIITAAANHIPPPLIKQLKEGGRLILPLGATTFLQTLTLATKKKDGVKIRQLFSVRFVPMTGRMLE
jgi:protein-L-isoaspartate(D-aspartate) O-methyltransferase